MYRILPLLSSAEVAECRRIAAQTKFVDGRATNPHNKTKNNQQLHDPAAGQASSQIMLQAFARSEEFREFAFPARIAPPLLTKYLPGQYYGAHADAAFIHLGPNNIIRSDLSCTIFLNEPDKYEGGELRIRLQDGELRFKLNPGEAIVYPSDTFHEVEKVTGGERLVAITFIQSQIKDPFHRNLLFDLNEVAALEGLGMKQGNFSRLQLVQSNLLRYWAGQALSDADPYQLNELGLDALEQGKVDRAIGYLAAAVGGDPAEPAIWMNLAKAHRVAGNDRDEQAALEGALAIDQLHLMARLRLAELHERLGEAGAATDHWSVFLGICSTISNQTAELRDMVVHAREFVDRQRQALARSLDEGLTSALGEASERDRRRARAAADVMAGRRQIYANQCHGFHYPFLPADEFFDRSHFPWLGQLEAAAPVIRQELEAILASPDPGLTPYIDMPSGTPENFWSELDKSPNWSALHLWRDGERVDAVCERAPATAALMGSLPVASIPGRAPAVFFSILKAGKRIPPHTGVTNIRSIVHLGLTVPPGCGFRVGGEVREWREGEAFVFDDTIEHEAWNNSGRDRALLILDCWNPHLSEAEQAMILRMFAISEAQRPDKPMRG